MNIRCKLGWHDWSSISKIESKYTGPGLGHTSWLIFEVMFGKTIDTGERFCFRCDKKQTMERINNQDWKVK